MFVWYSRLILPIMAGTSQSSTGLPVLYGTQRSRSAAPDRLVERSGNSGFVEFSIT